MSTEKPGSDDKEQEEKPLRPGEVRLKPAGEKTVKHEEKAPKAPDDKRIHRRRPLPLVPDKPAEGSEEDR